MRIQPPTVGPIVGYTPSDQVRLWLRGEFHKTPDGYRRCFGVAQLKLPGQPFGSPQFVKLPPYFDMTGVCAFSGLLAETNYEYRAGWFFAETELENLDASQEMDWSKSVSGRFRTGSANDQQERSYAVGSCRYLLRFFGGSFFDERGDKSFSSILNQIEHKTNPQQIDALVMVGDQIYADDLNFVAPDTTIDQYLERYREAFTQPYLRKLMGRVPTYMVLDDHEIEDNWPSKATEKDRVKIYPNAIHSYQIYQCSHSPLFGLDANNRLTGTPDYFWYIFRDGCCDWFVMDSRTERVWSSDPNKRRMISEIQMAALLNWLNDKSGRVKMVVTSVPFFPDLKSESEDKWSGFVPERTRILDFILANQIRKVVFLSGDVHCSFSVELNTEEDPAFKVISVVSSSFFWPYPHMDSGEFAFDDFIKSSSQNSYQVVNASAVFSTDNFARVTVNPNEMTISFFKRKGELLDSVHRTF
jgi:alkaline phosphatase D